MLSLVQLQMNLRNTEVYGVSPFELMYNRPASVFREFLPDALLNLDNLDADREQWRVNQQRILDELYPRLKDREAAIKFRESQAYARARSTLMKPDLVLEKGTKVMVWEAVRNNKNMPLYAGPFEVVSEMQNGKFLVQKTFPNAPPILYHRPVSLDELKILPKSASQHDILDEYSVEKLLGKKKSGEDWYYLVQFAGHEVADAEWTLASDINPKLRQAFDVEQTAIAKKQKRGEKKARKNSSQSSIDSGDQLDMVAPVITSSLPSLSSMVIPRKKGRGRPRKSML